VSKSATFSSSTILIHNATNLELVIGLPSAEEKGYVCQANNWILMKFCGRFTRDPMKNGLNFGGC